MTSGAPLIEHAVVIMRLLLDENFNNDILRGLLRRKPDLDVVRVQDVGLRGADDPQIGVTLSCANT